MPPTRRRGSSDPWWERGKRRRLRRRRRYTGALHRQCRRRRCGVTADRRPGGGRRRRPRVSHRPYRGDRRARRRGGRAHDAQRPGRRRRARRRTRRLARRRDDGCTCPPTRSRSSRCGAPPTGSPPSPGVRGARLSVDVSSVAAVGEYGTGSVRRRPRRCSHPTSCSPTPPRRSCCLVGSLSVRGGGGEAWPRVRSRSGSSTARPACDADDIAEVVDTTGAPVTPSPPASSVPGSAAHRPRTRPAPARQLAATGARIVRGNTRSGAGPHAMMRR